jgi:hypothetical protein
MEKYLQIQAINWDYLRGLVDKEIEFETKLFLENLKKSKNARRNRKKA